MARIFKEGFLKAYQAYANDDFVPELFNTWSGISIVAGALERKVWLPWSNTYSFYPNLYVLLVTNPGTGKSVSSGRAVDLLREVSRKTGHLNVLPDQATEASFIELMGKGRGFIDTSTGGEIITKQNAGYFYASEGSTSLNNIYGDFIAALTALYDCPSTFKRSTKKDGVNSPSLHNVCVNMLACCTFDFLGKLVSDDNIMGGFASRVLYICNEDKTVKVQEFQGGLNEADRSAQDEYRTALIADLTEISQLVGRMQVEAEVKVAWKKWYLEFEQNRLNNLSGKIKSIWARTNTNVLKVAMALSAGESSELIIRMRHWEEAVALVTASQLATPRIFRETRARSSSKSPTALTNSLITMVQMYPGMTLEQVKARAVMEGHNQLSVDRMVHALFIAKMLGHGVSGTVEILGNPDDHF